METTQAVNAPARALIALPLVEPPVARPRDESATDRPPKTPDHHRQFAANPHAPWPEDCYGCVDWFPF